MYLKEEFKPINLPEFSYRYDISNYGRVYDRKNNRYVVPVLTGGIKYFYVNLMGLEGRKLRRVHNLLARTWIVNPKPDIYDMVDHIDRNPYNNTIDNLRWVDRSGNARNQDSNVTYKGELLKDYCNKYDNPSAAYSYIYRIHNDFNRTLEQAEYIYNTYLGFGSEYTKRVKTSKGELFIVEVLDELNVTLQEYKDYVDSKKVKYEVKPNKVLEYNSIEFDNKWFPHPKSWREYYEIPEYYYKENKSLGLNYILSNYEKPRYNVYTVGNSKGTLEDLAKIYNIKLEIVKDRFYNKKMSIEDSINTPVQKIMNYLVNGVSMPKKTLLLKFMDEKKYKNFTKMQAKKKWTIQETLDYYGIDYSGYEITPDIYYREQPY